MTPIKSTWVLLSVIISVASYADELPKGFKRIPGKFVDVITDMEVDEHLKELPQIFDAAIPIWCEYFKVSEREVSDWHVEAFVMGAKERFRNAGLIPTTVPDFRYGFQFGNQIWVVEQPSDYYRRHLLLHEGTHWFMNRKYGDHGPPWLMEGIAEWMGTHHWDGKKLTMGIIPKTREEVPYWGRIALVQEQLAEGIAPTLETILQYDSRAHQDVDAYAWSWTAIVFLLNHPSTKDDMKALFKLKEMKSDQTLSKMLLKRMKPAMPLIRQEWNAMVTELEYGYDPSRGMMKFTREAKWIEKAPAKINVVANQSWQSSGIRVNEGDILVIDATGEFAVGKTSKPWKCFATGVTLEYYRGEPLGKLMLALADGINNDQTHTQPIEAIPVGDHLEITAPRAGELHFRINESNGGLADNAGQLTVSIRKK
jgi:hypothetical protein